MPVFGRMSDGGSGGGSTAPGGTLPETGDQGAGGGTTDCPPSASDRQQSQDDLGAGGGTLSTVSARLPSGSTCPSA